MARRSTVRRIKPFERRAQETLKSQSRVSCLDALFLGARRGRAHAFSRRSRAARCLYAPLRINFRDTDSDINYKSAQIILAKRQLHERYAERGDFRLHCRSGTQIECCLQSERQLQLARVAAFSIVIFFEPRAFSHSRTNNCDTLLFGAQAYLI